MGGIDNDLFGGLTVWELATGKAIRGTRSRLEGGVLDVAFDPSGRRLAAVHEDRESGRVVRVWGTRTGLEAASYGDPDMRAGYWHTGSLEASGRLHHPNAIAELRATLVIPYTSTARPFAHRSPRGS
jgi:hypothetical protein